MKRHRWIYLSVYRASNTQAHKSRFFTLGEKPKWVSYINIIWKPSPGPFSLIHLSTRATCFYKFSLYFACWVKMEISLTYSVLRLLEINGEPFMSHTSRPEPTEWFVPRERSVIFYLCLLCSFHMWFFHASPWHTLSVKRCEISATMRKFLPRWLRTDWSQTISFRPWAHCFPPVTSAIQKQLQMPVKPR